MLGYGSRTKQRWFAAAFVAAFAFGWTVRTLAQTVTEFPLPTTGASAYGIVAGPDGALWFTEYIPNKSISMPGSASKIGRIATDGTITEFALPTATSFPNGIVTGPDGALWFVETGSNAVGRITTDGTITEYPISFVPNVTPLLGAIAVGSDGALWFPEGFTGNLPNNAVIGRITTDGTISSFTIPQGYNPTAITAGPDGALYVVGCCGPYADNGIDRLTTAGTGAVIFGSNQLFGSDGIAAGPDGALWVTGGQAVGRITTSGAFTSFTASTAVGPNGIAAGPDGAMWFAGSAAPMGSGYNIGRITTSGTSASYPIPTSQNEVKSIAAGPDGAMWFTEAVVPTIGGTGAIGRITVPGSTGPLVAAVLPSSRSVQVGSTATAFATIINSGDSALSGCAITPVSGTPTSFLYQTTIAANNALTGTANTPVMIAAHGSQSFFLAFTANASFVPTDTVLGFDCANADAAPSISGLNTILLSGSTTPVPDVIALSATPSGDGTLHIPGPSGSAAFAIATTNVGAGGQMSFTVDTGATVLPLTLNFCPTDPTTAQCTGQATAVVPANSGNAQSTAVPASTIPAATARVTSLPISIIAGATPTFSIFATATGSIPFAPQTNRIFVRFFDTSGAERGSTSVAVTTQ
jgi:virginiamycin B lyase